MVDDHGDGCIIIAMKFVLLNYNTNVVLLTSPKFRLKISKYFCFSSGFRNLVRYLSYCKSYRTNSFYLKNVGFSIFVFSLATNQCLKAHALVHKALHVLSSSFWKTPESK